MDLRAKPFYLDEEAVHWVDKTLQSLSVEEKIGQLFVPLGYSGKPEYLESEILSRHVGGMMYRRGDPAETQEVFRYLQEHSRVPT